MQHDYTEAQLKQIVADAKAHNEQEARDSGGDEFEDTLRTLMVNEIADVVDCSLECAYDIFNHYGD